MNAIQITKSDDAIQPVHIGGPAYRGIDGKALRGNLPSIVAFVDEPKVSLTLETGKYYRTRDGRKAFVSSVEIGNPFGGVQNPYPVIGYIEGSNSVPSWTAGGRILMDGERDCDLVAEWVEPKRIKGWIAFLNGAENVTTSVHPSKEMALSVFSGEGSFAVIEVDVLEGAGLEGAGQ